MKLISFGCCPGGVAPSPYNERESSTSFSFRLEDSIFRRAMVNFESTYFGKLCSEQSRFSVLVRALCWEFLSNPGYYSNKLFYDYSRQHNPSMHRHSVRFNNDFAESLLSFFASPFAERMSVTLRALVELWAYEPTVFPRLTVGGYKDNPGWYVGAEGYYGEVEDVG